MKTHKTLTEAKAEFKRQTGVPFGSDTFSGVKIWDRRKCKWRTSAQKKALKRPFFVGTQLEWLNCE